VVAEGGCNKGTLRCLAVDEHQGLKSVSEGCSVRRLGATVAVAMLLALTFAGSAEARPKPAPPPLVTSVTIIETGGSWPYCSQSATISYTAGRTPGAVIWLTPYLEGGTVESSYYAMVRGSGTVEVAMPRGADFSQTNPAQSDGWFWAIGSGNQRAPWEARWGTTSWDFAGACPAPGTVLATGPEPLPWS
jgi:hypothetical protein